MGLWQGPVRWSEIQKRETGNRTPGVRVASQWSSVRVLVPKRVNFSRRSLLSRGREFNSFWPMKEKIRHHLFLFHKCSCIYLCVRKTGPRMIPMWDWKCSNHIRYNSYRLCCKSNIAYFSNKHFIFCVKTRKKQLYICKKINKICFAYVVQINSVWMDHRWIQVYTYILDCDL